MPIVGREPTDGGETAHVFEPRSKTTSKCVKPRHADRAEPITMGMMLRRAQDEIEDVEVISEKAAASRLEEAAEASAASSELSAPSPNARTGQDTAPDDQIERGGEAAQSPSAGPVESMSIPVEESSADGAAVQHGGGFDEPPPFAASVWTSPRRRNWRSKRGVRG
jgi:hypothetical protein